MVLGTKIRRIMGSYENIDRIMEKARREEVFPGGVLLVSRHGRVLLEKAWGVTDIFTGKPVTTDTVFDLASLTKPLVGAMSVMTLVSKGRLDFETRAGDLIPGFDGSDKGDIKLINLLCHNSGLPDYKPYYRELRFIPDSRRGEWLRQLLLNEKMCDGMGERVVYSDLGYMLVKMMIEAAAGNSLDDFAEGEIFRPLGIEDLFFIRKGGKRPAREFAATELSPWRGGVLSGIVHDENAYVMGGVSAHAGLFGTAGAVHALLARLVVEYGGGGEFPFFGTELVRPFLHEHEDTGRTPGFDMPSPEGSSSGHFFSKKSVGHLGYTGTSFWMDLEREIIVILLTNRVHPTRNNTAIRSFRPLIHDAVMEWVSRGPNLPTNDKVRGDGTNKIFL